MKHLFIAGGLAWLLTGCSLNFDHGYQFKPNSLSTTVIEKYQQLAEQYGDMDFDPDSATLTVTRSLPSGSSDTRYYWQGSVIRRQVFQGLCQSSDSFLYHAAHVDKIAIKMVFEGQGGKTAGPWNADICEFIDLD